MQSTLVTVVCAHCQQSFSVRPAQNRRNRRFCSKSCATRSRPGSHKARTHGACTNGRFTPEYRVWKSIRQRCLNPNNPGYANYGGRGITICAAWRDDFAQFLADMGPRPSLDYSIERVDNDGPYSAANCVWADRTTQNTNNRRNIHLTHAGRTQTLTEWARELGIERTALHYRIFTSGWTVEQAFTTPVCGQGGRPR